MDVDADSPPEEVLGQAAWALYGVPPAEFVAERKAWVKRVREAGHREVAKEVGALRKPSVAAAAVNTLVHSGEPVVATLRDVGTRMRHAQAALDAAGLTALRPERDAVLAEWVAAAHRHAPGGLTAAVEAEVRDTAVAALADAAASEVATSGTLTRALGYSGFGEVDVADAVARTSTGVVLTRIEGGEDGEPEKAEPEEEENDGDEEADEPVGPPDPLAELEDELERAEEAVTRARTARRQAARDDEQAQQLLAAAQEQLDRASRHREETATVLAAADEALGKARRDRDSARTALEEAQDA